MNKEEKGTVLEPMRESSVELEKRLDEYLASYETCYDDGDYAPSDEEKFRIKDAIFGWLHNEQERAVAPQASPKPSDDGIHSCGYHCMNPACILAQRNELAAQQRAETPQASPEPTVTGKHIVGDDPEWVLRHRAQAKGAAQPDPGPREGLRVGDLVAEGEIEQQTPGRRDSMVGGKWYFTDALTAQAQPTARPGFAHLSRTDLRALVDHVWSNAKESEEVPGFPEADEMIDHALGDDVFAQSKGAAQAPTDEPTHIDDEAVDKLASAMKDKLERKRGDGYAGWQEDEGYRGGEAYSMKEHLNRLLHWHVAKGDPIDVANFCAFLHYRRERIQPMPIELPSVEAVSAAVHDAWMDSKRAQGVSSRLAEDGEELMAPYSVLSDKAKELDRGTVKAVYAAILASRTDGAAEAEPGP